MTMRMTLKPETLDTIVATNLHADILSDLAAALAGSLGIAPTANINPERTTPSMFEPIHGSAFDITGKGVANPVATFWTGAMMLEHLGEKDAAARLMRAVERVTADPALHTPDLGGSATTRQVTDAVCRGAARRQSLAAASEPEHARRRPLDHTSSGRSDPCTGSPRRLLASLLLAGTAASAATDYPTQPITVLVPHAAGGPTDTVARLVAESMTGTLGQQLLVENAGGAGSTAGHRARRPGRARRLHPPAQPRRPGFQRHPVPQAVLRSGRRVRRHRPDHRRADDHRRPGRFRAEHDRRADRVHPRQQGHRHLRPCRRRLGIAPVRHAVHGCDRRAADHRPLQGHRPGDDRPPGRPGRRDVRPDHQHREPDQDRQDQGLRGDHQGAAGGAARSADPGRVGPRRASR